MINENWPLPVPLVRKSSSPTWRPLHLQNCRAPVWSSSCACSPSYLKAPQPVELRGLRVVIFFLRMFSLSYLKAPPPVELRGLGVVVFLRMFLSLKLAQSDIRAFSISSRSCDKMRHVNQSTRDPDLRIRVTPKWFRKYGSASPQNDLGTGIWIRIIPSERIRIFWNRIIRNWRIQILA